jgi:predicted dehydrogenase
VLSTANIGIRAVIPAIQLSRNGKVVAIASRTLERAREAAAPLGVRAYGSYQALLDDPDVQAIYIPLPNSMHREWTIRCAEAGKHVLCEKPLATSAAECEDMIDSCRRHGVVLMEAFMYRFHPRTRRVAEMASAGAIGDLRLVRATFSFTIRNPESNIRLNPELGGGALYDVGCYCVNVGRMLLGEPLEAFAWARMSGGVDDVLSGVLRFPGERTAMIDCGLRLPRREEYEVVGDAGRLIVYGAFLPGTADTEIHHVRNGDRAAERIGGVNQSQIMVEHFADVVASGAPLQMPPQEAAANLRAIEALLRSARSGRPEPVAAR